MGLNNISGFMSAARLIHKDINAVDIHALFTIASREEQGMTTKVSDVKDALEIPSSSATRAVQKLSVLQDGAGLIDYKVNPERQNERLLVLTTLGRRTVKSLLETLYANYTERKLIPGND